MNSAAQSLSTHSSLGRVFTWVSLLVAVGMSTGLMRAEKVILSLIESVEQTALGTVTAPDKVPVVLRIIAGSTPLRRVSVGFSTATGASFAVDFQKVGDVYEGNIDQAVVNGSYALSGISLE